MILQVISPSTVVPFEGYTYWHTPCLECTTDHYTLSLKDTIAHAKAYHPDSSFAIDGMYKVDA